MRQFKPDSYSVSKVFNEYFCDVAGSTGHLLEIDDFNNHPSINTIKENTNASNSTFCFVPAGSDYIRKILDNLNLKKLSDVIRFHKEFFAGSQAQYWLIR